MSLEHLRLEELVAETGFRPETLEKVIRLGDLAGDIHRHPLLGRVLVLKGGTALNLCFGPPQRLSVDLDYNYVGALDRAAMQEARPEVEGALEALAERKGFRLQRSPRDHAGRTLYLGYRSSIGVPDQVQVDVNYLFREPLVVTEQCSLWQPGQLERPATRIVGLEELCAGKICALLSRRAPRDLYDVAFLPSKVGELWHKARFRRFIVAFSSILTHPMSSYGLERLDEIDDQSVESQLLPMLQQGRSITANRLREMARDALEPILDLSPQELDFVQRVQQGELRLELLFDPADEIADRFRRHPAVQWKIRNARAHQKRGV
ncbi:MAG: nucleotidyl transferase AbiEii/AbiGii toxin family protein [Acidobacteriota bacterium]|nr:nucleotidyl transferase AbiEii/AbiGii toxin family protein [Acidobacteriota bacterium]